MRKWNTPLKQPRRGDIHVVCCNNCTYHMYYVFTANDWI